MDKENTSSSSLEMSDEDFAKVSPSEFEAALQDEVEDTIDNEDTSDSEEDNSSDEDDDSSQDTEDDSDAQEQPEDDSDEEEVGQPEGDASEEHENSSEDDDSESLDTGESDEKSEKDTASSDKDFDYKSAFEEITKPFKANGIEMQVKDPQDIVRLMQMGANYQKKMQQLKPSLKAMKMLDQHGLLGDEGKLNFLIDLSKKDPKAIARLVQESEIDPLDIDTDEAKDYTAKDYSLSDSEFALDEVLEDIKSSPSFDKTITVLSKDWDEKSRAATAEDPNIIRMVNAHMDNGIFDKVHSIIQQERTLGRMNGLSDLEAYTATLDKLIKEGALVRPSSSSTKDSKKPADVPESSKTTKSAAERKKKRKAAAPNKVNKPAITEDMEKDLLNLSDEDFMAKYGIR